jgi:cell wall-associated NlpC family hydrolase
MSSLGKAILLVALLFASESIVSAEQRSDAATLDDGPRLLTRAEGEALVDLAVAHPVAGRRLDCSHLVHQILTAAGLTYPYASSLEIFAGVSQFQRVGTAQPGDLIVWPGHVGLVVDEERRQFFSATHRGVRTDEYDKDYWRKRGHPRFYRYVVPKDTEIEVLRVTASAQ